MANNISTSFVEAFNESADQLEKLNQRFPNLANDYTVKAVETFRRKPIELAHDHSKQDDYRIETELAFSEPEEEPVAGTELAFSEPEEEPAADGDRLVETARELLAIHSFEDVLDILETEHKSTLNMVQLINMVGNDAYIAALRREAREFQSNAISLGQIVQLWKDFGRPSVGDSAWTERSVSMLLE